MALGSRFASAQEIHLPEPVVDIPKGANFRWVDTGDIKMPFYREFFRQYGESRGITVTYDGLPWPEIANIVPLGVRNGTAHDVFQLPLTMRAQQAVAEGWVQALDDLIPDFEAWKSGFPEGVFVEGLNMFGGKTYGMPYTSGRQHSVLTLFNRQYLNDAGFDPEETPFTWDTFREAARKVTENGKGQYYGFIVGGGQVNRWLSMVDGLVQFAGKEHGFVFSVPIDFRTGEVSIYNDEAVGAVELLLAMRDDGSFFPGDMNLNAPQARSFMPQGGAAMMLQGPWNVTGWERENPDYDFGVASAPGPQGDARGHFTAEAVAQRTGTMFIYAKSAHPEIAADIFHHLGSLEGQVDIGNWFGVANSPVFPKAMELASISERSKKTQAILNEDVRIGPNPYVSNGDLGVVAEIYRGPAQDLGATVQGLFTGQITDIRGSLQQLQDETERALDAAFAEAAAQGAKVSRDDLVFPDWDPSADYV